MAYTIRWMAAPVLAVVCVSCAAPGHRRQSVAMSDLTRRAADGACTDERRRG
jgi:hypothetical protein